MGKSFMFVDPGSHGGLNCPDICWKDNTGNHRSWGSVDCIDENFLTQVMDDLMRGGTLLDRITRKKVEVVEEEKVGGNLGCCDHEMVEFVILKGGKKANNMITTLDYRTAKAHLRLNLGRDRKGNMKDFYRSFHSKREIMENEGLPLNGAGDLVMKDMQKLEVPNAFFTSAFTDKIYLRSHSP